jgi:regulator of cell morphogenesis and NO signaling
MELFEPGSRLASVIFRDHTLLPVINRLGVRLGFGDLTISEVCEKEGIDLPFFLEIINVFHSENYFPEKKLLDFPVTLLIDYLRKTHAYYLGYMLPEQERMIRLMLEKSGTGFRENELIQKFYHTFRAEFIIHVEYEEQYVFPYVLALDQYVRNQNSGKEKDIAFRNQNLREFQKEHHDMDEKMFDLKSILIRFLPPNYEHNIVNSLISSIFMFEKDLKNHSRIEDKILIPKVSQLEKQLL